MTKRRKKKSRSSGAGERKRAAHAPRQAGHRTAAPDGLGRLLLGLTALGMALTGYLTASHWWGASLPYCGAESSCDIVQSSRWSVLFGLPLSAWGFLTYALLAALVWRGERRRGAWSKAWLLAWIGFAFSIYLTVVSVVEIRATCVYCLASLALLGSIFALLTWRAPRRAAHLAWGTWAPSGLAAAIVVVGGLHLHYSGLFDPAMGPEKPYLQALAKHLNASGAAFYGADWCPRCQDQKDLFEASAHRLPYVECAPQGPRGPQTPACLTRNIANYPTWIINGERHVGVLDPPELSKLSGFNWKEPDA